MAADWLAARKCSAVPEKPLKTASGGVYGVLSDVVMLCVDKAAPAPSRGVRIFFMVSESFGRVGKTIKNGPQKGPFLVVSGSR